MGKPSFPWLIQLAYIGEDSAFLIDISDHREHLLFSDDRFQTSHSFSTFDSVGVPLADNKPRHSSLKIRGRGNIAFHAIPPKIWRNVDHDQLEKTSPSGNMRIFTNLKKMERITWRNKQHLRIGRSERYVWWNHSSKNHQYLDIVEHHSWPRLHMEPETTRST